MCIRDRDMGPSGAGKTRITLEAPSRSLIGYQGEFLTDTRGSGVLNRVFSHYAPDMGPSGAGKTRITLEAPSRSLIGYQGEFLTDTRGSGVLNRVFSHYAPYKG